MIKSIYKSNDPPKKTVAPPVNVRIIIITVIHPIYFDKIKSNQIKIILLDKLYISTEQLIKFN